MLQNTFTLLRVAGVPIGVHYTWLFAAGLVAWSLAQGYFPGRYPGWDVPTYWIAGIVAALGLFTSVVLHELGHTLVALARGVKVKRITLWIFGGVAQMTEEVGSAIDDLLIGIAGPATSFALAAGFWAGTQVAPSGSIVEAVLGYLAFVNAMLGGFNLVPGFPLDGGRVLRAIVWKATGSERRATQWASYAGQAVAYLLMFLGVSRLLGGDTLGGLWTAMIGMFLNGAAQSARRQQDVKERLGGVRVADLMDPRPPVVDPQTTLQEFVYLHMLRHGRRAVLVAGEDGRLQGLVTATDVKETPQPEWPATTLDRVMTRPPLKSVAPTSDVNDALRLLVEGDFNQVPVVAEGRVVGLLSRAAILRLIQLHETLHVDPIPTPLRPTALRQTPEQHEQDEQPTRRAA